MEDPGVGGRRILRRIFRSGMGGMDGSIWLRIRTGGCTCKRGNEPSGSIKYGGFLG
jgi:hypothetical protein